MRQVLGTISVTVTEYIIYLTREGVSGIALATRSAMVERPRPDHVPNENGSDMTDFLYPVVRRVVTGTDASGRSTVVSDGPVEAVAPRPDGSQVMDIWRMPAVPPTTSDGDGLDGRVVAPDLGGLVYRLCWVAPNDDMDPAAYARSMAVVYGAEAVTGRAATLVGGHATETVDVVTVIRGELIAVFENDEVVLRPGDSLVQRGTVHAWRNRTSEPVLIATVMVGARRP